LGAASVIYWDLTERQGIGDLRLYGFVQFYGIASIPLLVWLFPSRYPGDGLDRVLALYALALLTGEILDEAIFAASQVVSGHTLKHLLAGWAIYAVLERLRQRPRPDSQLV
jgi:hypothetical protein